MICSICRALEGSVVLRLKDPVHWYIWWPAPLSGIPGSELPADKRQSSPYARLLRRENESSRFISQSGAFEPKPRPVNINELGQCTWCTDHLKKAWPPPCPRCVPATPPKDPEPCPLCGGAKIIRGVHTVDALIDKIVEASRTRA